MNFLIAWTFGLFLIGCFEILCIKAQCYTEVK